MPNQPILRRQRPLFVFDGHCVLCSGGASFIMKHDREGRIEFASGQSELGTRLYQAVGLPVDDSYLLIDGDGWHIKSDGYFQLARHLGGWWRAALIARIIPRPVRDWAYDKVAANRYQWFGRVGQCVLLTPVQRARLVHEGGELDAQLDALGA